MYVSRTSVKYKCVIGMKIASMEGVSSVCTVCVFLQHGVLTFDEGGVSGHANHIAIYKALSHLAFGGRLPEDCQVFSLYTISTLRKYLSILELPISWLLPSSFCCILTPNEYKKAKEAMLHHRSQLVWFRRLYILFSRYMFVNTFRAVPVEKNDLKFY